MPTATSAQAATPSSLLVLIGLPGCGKSTVGRHLARRLGVAFVDSDQVIEQRIGCSIRLFFDREGEDAFRDMEEAVLDELTAGTTPAVLSTGAARCCARPTVCICTGAAR